MTLATGGSLSKEEITAQLSKEKDVNNLVLELGPKAISQFKKYHPLNVSVSYTSPYQLSAVLRTFVDVHKPEELNEMMNWLLFLGVDIKVREMPEALVRGLQERRYFYPLPTVP